MGNDALPGQNSGLQGNKSGVLDYRREGGDRPAELLAKEPGPYGLERGIISAIDKLTPSNCLEMTPTANRVPEFTVAARRWGALAAIRHAFRLPEAASTAKISGCRSSVREITGNRRARTQTIATASILVLCLGFRRDKVQRYRHSQTAATETASQTRLRKVSTIGSRQCHPQGRVQRPPRPKRAMLLHHPQFTTVGNPAANFCTSDFQGDLHSGACAAEAAMIAFARCAGRFP